MAYIDLVDDKFCRAYSISYQLWA